MPREFEITNGQSQTFSDQDRSALALDLPQLRPPLYARAFIVFLSIFFLVSIVYSSFTTIPVVVESGGRIINENPPVPVRATTHFTIKQILVIENQVVKKDELLIKANQSLGSEELEILNSARKELQVIANQKPESLCLECPASLKKLAALRPRLRGKPIVVEILNPAFEAIGQLEGVLSKLKTFDAKARELKGKWQQISLQTKELEKKGPKAASQLGARRSQQQALQRQISEIYRPVHSEFQQRLMGFRATVQEIDATVQAIVSSGDIKAPFEGRIINLKIKGVGELVGAGQQLLEVLPESNRFLASIEVRNRDIGALKVGDQVEVVIDAYPEMDYGYLTGSISQILPGDQSDSQQGQAGQEKFFQVRVELAQQEVKAQGQVYPLLPGMTLRSRVLKRQETLLRTFYRAVFRIKNDLRVQNK